MFQGLNKIQHDGKYIVDKIINQFALTSPYNAHPTNTAKNDELDK